MDYTEWFSKRLSQLRIAKGVSARDMSLTLGQSESYINKIENKRTLPSMNGFFYICEFLEISPMQFFDTESENPGLSQEIIREINILPKDKAEHIFMIIKDLNGK